MTLHTLVSHNRDFKIYDAVVNVNATKQQYHRLRTVPIIVIAHTFCVSRDTRISYGYGGAY